MRSASPRCVIFLQCLGTEKSNAVVVGRASVQLAQVHRGNRAKRIPRILCYIIGHYLNWPDRFPDVIQVLKDEVHAIAESEDLERRKLITTDGKSAIPDIVAYTLEEFLLRAHGSDSVPSIGKSEYALYIMFQARVGCRAQIESANMMKRHFVKEKVYGWPGYKHVFDLAQKK
jgi:hypothetical protein